MTVHRLVSRLWQLTALLGGGAMAWQFIRSLVILRDAKGVSPLAKYTVAARAAIDAFLFPLASLVEIATGLSHPRLFNRLAAALQRGPAVSTRYGAHPRHTVDIYLPRGFKLNATSALEQATRRSSVGLAPSRARPADLHLVPTVVFVHGGAWAFGEPWYYASFAGTIANNMGVAVIVPSYRVYPHANAAGMTDDIIRLLRWIQQRSAQNYRLWGADAKRAERRDVIQRLRTKTECDVDLGPQLVGHERGSLGATLVHSPGDSQTSLPSALAGPDAHTTLTFEHKNALKEYLKSFPYHADTFRGAGSFSAPLPGSALDAQLRRNEHPGDLPSLPGCVDASRLILFGQSAGAHIALCAVLRLAGQAVGPIGHSIVESLSPAGARGHVRTGAEPRGNEPSSALVKRGKGMDDAVSSQPPTTSAELNTSVTSEEMELSSEGARHILSCVRGFVGLSGVYCIKKHFAHEATRRISLGPLSLRGVERVSPMAPAMGGDVDRFDRMSPARLLQEVVGPTRRSLLASLPPLLLLHGLSDDVVPPSSTADLLHALYDAREIHDGKMRGGHSVDAAFLLGTRFSAWVGPLRVTAVPLAGVDHIEPILALMGYSPVDGTAVGFPVAVPRTTSQGEGRDYHLVAVAGAVLAELKDFCRATLRKPEEVEAKL